MIGWFASVTFSRIANFPYGKGPHEKTPYSEDQLLDKTPPWASGQLIDDVLPSAMVDYKNGMHRFKL